MEDTKTTITEYYVVKYSDIYKNDKIWSIETCKDKARSEVRHIANQFDDIKEVWIEHKIKTETIKMEYQIY